MRQSMQAAWGKGTGAAPPPLQPGSGRRFASRNGLGTGTASDASAARLGEARRLSTSAALAQIWTEGTGRGGAGRARVKFPVVSPSPRGIHTHARPRPQVFHSRAATRRGGLARPRAGGRHGRGPARLHGCTGRPPKRHEGKKQRAAAVGGGWANKTAQQRRTVADAPGHHQRQPRGAGEEERSARGHRRQRPERARWAQEENGAGERRRRASRLAAARIPAPVRAVMAWWRKKVVTPARRAWAAVSTRVRARNTGTLATPIPAP
ncbi:hypothetical protein SETIT_7G226900v2 [Setaria italica]|uniref:Uncharacterized protein n=1 Tax=Setaria italica TaxID=4555 RepID=A0A368RYJ3_SETIT|nr:hypothetical protein SETIT_7G226900v2 [Setaria italica]